MARNPSCTGHTDSAPAPAARTSSSSSCFQRPHVGWHAIRIGTAKCDMCSKQSRGVVQRCSVCALCVCRPCVQDGALLDNKTHVLDRNDPVVDWRPAKTKRRHNKVKKRAMAAPTTLPIATPSDLSEMEHQAANILVRMPTLETASYVCESPEPRASYPSVHTVQAQVPNDCNDAFDQQRQLEPPATESNYPPVQYSQESQRPAYTYTYAQSAYPDPGVYLDHQQHCSYYYAPQARPYSYPYAQRLPSSVYNEGQRGEHQPG